MFVVPGTEE